MTSWWSNMDAALGQVKSLTSHVSDNLSSMDTATMLQSLTLTSPELAAERQRIDAEERRKEQIRDSLAGLLPWETRDAERDILVEECRDAVLALSRDRATFFGPYEMPKSGRIEAIVVGEEDDDDGEVVEREDGDEKEETADDETSKKAAKTQHYQAPTPASLEKLQKLQPLPILLRDFDLNAHVGLINRLLKVDPHLVEMQSTYSGGGARELVFWRNYFFHCAYTRYEAGLSIDEIWSDTPPVFASTTPEEALAAPGREQVAEDDEEQEIAFDDKKNNEEGKAFRESDTTTAAGKDVGGSGEKDSKSGSTSSYQIVGGDDNEDFLSGVDASGHDHDDDDDDDAPIDYELDELEAEIARELEE